MPRDPRCFNFSSARLSPAVRAASATSAATTATAAGLFRPSFIDGHCAAIEFLIVHGLNGLSGCVVVGHFDEGEAFASSGVSILNDLGARDGTELGEDFLQLRAVDVVAQIADIKLLTHNTTPTISPYSGRSRPWLKTFWARAKGTSMVVRQV